MFDEGDMAGGEIENEICYDINVYKKLIFSKSKGLVLNNPKETEHYF